ncbi:hypothetical protein, partial [Gordonia humi]
MHTMSPADAAMFWAARVADNDQFLLFAFDDVGPVSDDEMIGEIRRRAAGIADLQLGVATVPGDLDFPRWVPSTVRGDAVVVHPSPGGWAACLDAIAGLARTQLREDGSLWRVHVFGDVARDDGPIRVVVLQISHALGDGRRATAIGRALFGGEPPTPSDAPAAVGDGLLAAVRGGIMIGPHLARATAHGLAAWAAAEPEPGASPVAPTRSNAAPATRRELRTLTLPRDRVRIEGARVTVGVLTVLADVLPSYLDAAPREASVELTLGFDDDGDDRLPRNRFQTVGIGLHAHVHERARRAELIG